MQVSTIPTLIFCASGNRTFAELAKRMGFELGARLPGTIYHPIYFADQDWKKPDREGYMTALAKHRPYMASAIDWERQEQLEEVLSWAEEIAQYSEVVVIIPKVFNGVSQIPREIGGKKVRLGYSVPTKHGGTSLMVSEFYSWPVHLLGGSPHAQVALCRYLPGVVSADGNMASKMATRFCSFYDYDWRGGKHSHWPTIFDVDGKRWEGENAPAEAMRRSFKNILKYWIDHYRA